MPAETVASWTAPFRKVAAVREQRWFALAMLVNALGNGVFVTVSALYFTRILDVPLTLYGLVLAVAGGAGLLVGPALGHLADRLGSRGLYVALLVVQGVATFLCLVPDATWLALGSVVVSTAAQRGAAAARGALTAALVPREGRVEFRAVVRSVVNGAAAVGAGAGAVVLAADTPTSYRIALIANALTFIAAAACLARCVVPSARSSSPVGASPVVGADGPMRYRAVRDPGFLGVTMLNAVLVLHSAILGVALPLWVAGRTDAPLWVVSLLVVINTVGVVLLQVRAGRGIDDVRSAAGAGRRAALALAGCAVLFGFTGSTSGVVTVALLVLAGAAHLMGELWQAVSGWGLSFELAPEDAQGQYQGVFNAGQDAVTLFAPVLFAWVVDTGGAAGWWGLAGVFGVVALVFPSVALWARDRSPVVAGRAVDA